MEGRAKAAAIPLLTVALSLLLTVVNGFSLTLAALFVSLSLLFVMAVKVMLESNSKAYARKRLDEAITGFLYRVVYYKSGKGSYLVAVDKAAGGTPEEGAKRIVGRASRGLKLSGESELLGTRLSGTDDLNGMRGALSAHELHLNDRQSALEESSQRYAIANMFISTVVPSFLVFAFIGSAILSTSGFSMLLLSVTLLIFIPMFYAIGNSLLSRKLYA